MNKRYASTILRGIDVLAASALLVFLAPLMALTALVVSLDGGPIIFAHMRIGRGGKLFPCWKFRSMVPDASQRLADLLARDTLARVEWERDHKLRNDPRVTPLGAFLRKSSLDELPQLFNILVGHMSLVGPRPIVEAEAKKYGIHLRHYCAVRPGLTGLWQVSGRNDVDYRRRVVMDVAYTRNRCLVLYFSILMRTAPAVLLRRGSY